MKFIKTCKTIRRTTRGNTNLTVKAGQTLYVWGTRHQGSELLVTTNVQGLNPFQVSASFTDFQK